MIHFKSIKHNANAGYICMSLFYAVFLSSFLQTASAEAFDLEPPSQFIIGVGTHPLSYNGDPEDFVKLLKKYNIKSFRFDYPWNMVEKEKGVYNPASDKLDAIINLASENGIQPLIILDYGNQLYGIKKPISKDELHHFLNYVDWTVNHFKHLNPIYEVWNEWSLGKPRSYWESNASAELYFQLVKSVSFQIKKNNVKSILIAGSFCPTFPNQVVWAKELINLGIMNYVDGISIHPYNDWLKPMDSPIQSLNKINDMAQSLSSAAGKNIDIYITEYGIPDGKNAKLSQQEIYQFAKSYYAEAKRNKHIRGVWWYDFINDGNDRKNAEHNFGVLNNDLSEKPISQLFRQDLKK